MNSMQMMKKSIEYICGDYKEAGEASEKIRKTIININLNYND